MSFYRLIEKKTTILFDVLRIAFFKTLAYISMHFHSLAYSVPATFYKLYEYIKISQTERNWPIYLWADLYIL